MTEVLIEMLGIMQYIQTPWEQLSWESHLLPGGIIDITRLAAVPLVFVVCVNFCGDLCM